MSLSSQRSPLARPEAQLAQIGAGSDRLRSLARFSESLARAGHRPFRPGALEIFQINVGKMCNQTCRHCHVDAGPDRREIMSRETMELCLAAVRESGARTVDITGGAPEMNPHFRWLVEELTALEKKVMVRCNLTILLANATYADLPEFYAAHRVNVVSSLPFYDKRTDRQRGDGVFERSIEALRRLNRVGYGDPATGLELDLVYNPVGAFLPASQAQLEADFKRELSSLFGVRFSRLFAITNMPISRFLEFLVTSDNLESYMERLVSAFNPAATAGLMCRNTISVGWDGQLYDCDFNQMLEMPLATPDGAPVALGNADWPSLHRREIRVDQHCYGCTAGAGSSCGGTLVDGAS